MTAMWLAVHAPERVDRLVLLLHVRATRPARRSGPNAAATVRAQGTEAIADGDVARWLTPAFARPRTRTTAAAARR